MDLLDQAGPMCVLRWPMGRGIFNKWSNMLTPPKIGDWVETAAKPIAKILGIPCHDQATGRLKSDSPCAKRRNKVNDFFYNATEKLNQFFYGPTKTTETERTVIMDTTTLPINPRAAATGATAGPVAPAGMANRQPSRQVTSLLLEQADNEGWIVTKMFGGVRQGVTVYANRDAMIGSLPQLTS